MSTLAYVIIFSILGGVVSLIGGVWLLRSKKSARQLAKYATPFAGGALLAAVFLDLLKEGVEIGDAETVLLAALIGMVVFFLAEGFLTWFHHHHSHDDKKDPATWLIIVGDTLHNALDGMAIAAAFLVSVPTGIVTAIAVAAHEIPQEIGDFGLLLSKGMRRRNVLLVNLLSAFATVFFAVMTFLIGSENGLPIGALLGLSAGFLLYIAASDVIPSIHENHSKKGMFDIQALLLLAGVLSVGIITTLSHQYIDAGHDHDSESVHVDDHEHEHEDHEEDSRGHSHEDEDHHE